MSVADDVVRLRASGFLLSPLPNLLAGVDGLYGVRFTAGRCVDSVVIRAEECAVAARVRDVFDPADPLVEVSTLWRSSGDLTDVVGELLSLPRHGGRPGSPRHQR